MSEKINGTPVNFGIAGITSPGIDGFFQDANHGLESKLASAQNEGGETKTDVFYDPSATAEIRFKVTGSDLADAQANTSLEPYAPGTFLVISACPRRPDLVHSNWVVTEAGPKTVGGNTDIAEISIPLRRRDGITSAAT